MKSNKRYETPKPLKCRGRVVVVYPKFDVDRVLELYFPKFEGINANAHGVGEGV